MAIPRPPLRQPARAAVTNCGSSSRSVGRRHAGSLVARHVGWVERWGPRRQLYPDVRLHLIGPLQTNKVADAVALFDVIEVVDRPKLASALAAEMDRQNRHLACYIQVNTGDEPQKSGISPDDTDAFISFCRDQLGLDIAGLMCIPPIDEEAAMHFALLQMIARRNGITNLSMGMSGDFDIAIGFGATAVRVGSAIFGARDA